MRAAKIISLSSLYLFLTLPLFPNPESNPDSNTQEALSRIQQVETEIASLGKHEWAGSYAFRQSLTTHRDWIALAPASGFVRWGGSCFGGFSSPDYGEVYFDGDYLRLKSQSEDSVTEEQLFIPVIVGGDECLLDRNQAIRFCQDLAAIRKDGRMSTQYRIFERLAPITSANKKEFTAPKEFEHWTNLPTIKGELESRIDFESHGVDRIKARVAINFGESDGLFPDAEVLVSLPDYGEVVVTLTTVSEQNSVGDAEFFDYANLMCSF